jgi:hypothetical protein
MANHNSSEVEPTSTTRSVWLTSTEKRPRILDAATGDPVLMSDDVREGLEGWSGCHRSCALPSSYCCSGECGSSMLRTVPRNPSFMVRPGIGSDLCFFCQVSEGRRVRVRNTHQVARAIIAPQMALIKQLWTKHTSLFTYPILVGCPSVTLKNVMNSSKDLMSSKILRYRDFLRNLSSQLLPASGSGLQCP